MTEIPPGPQGGDAAALAAEPVRRASRLGLYLPFAGLLALVLVWSGVWFFTASRAEKFAETLLAREAARGRNWLCPERALSGYPFSIRLTCTRPQLVLAGANGLESRANLAGVTLHSRILEPGHFVAVLTPPFALNAGRGGGLDLTWDRAEASLRAGSAGIREGDLNLIEPRLAVGTGEQRSFKASAKTVEVHLRRSPGDTPGVDLVAAIKDLTQPLIDELSGVREAMQAELQLTAPGFSPTPDHGFFETLEAWRVGGGTARVLALNLTKGPARIELSGTLGIDAAHRLEGTVQGRAKNLDSLTKRLLGRSGLDLGGLLGALSGGDQGLPVNLTLANGRLRYGPFPLAEFGPLY